MTRDISIGLIDRDPGQPRQHFDEARLAELAQSMDAKGLVVPISVRPTGDRFTIIHGERRWRAAKRLGWPTIRAEVRSVSTDEARWLALIENVQRADLSPIEQARAFEGRLTEGLTQAELGERVGKSQSYIAQKLRLLRMPEPLRFFVDREAITEGHARQLLKLKGIYPKGLTHWLDWGEVEANYKALNRKLEEPVDDTKELVFEVFIVTRPEDNPIWWPGMSTQEDNRDILRQGARVFLSYAFEQRHVPLWAVGAFWFACLAIDGSLSVVDLSKVIDTWAERIYSAAAWLDTRGDKEPPSKAETDWDWLYIHRYWGHRSDLRHAGLLRWLEKDEAELSDEERKARAAFQFEALKWVLKEEQYAEPSSLQSWGEVYKAHKERYQRATERERGGWFD